MLKGQCGAALLIALIMLAVGGLIIAPLIGLITTSLIVGQSVEENMKNYYAADAGVEQGIWNVKTKQDLSIPFSLQLNGSTVQVTTEDLSESFLLQVAGTARQGPHSSDLSVTKVLNGDTVVVTVVYNGSTSGNKKLSQVGVWLFGEKTYVSSTAPGNSLPTLTPVMGGTLFLWDVNLSMKTPSPWTSSWSLTFSPSGSPPTCLAFAKTLPQDIGITDSGYSYLTKITSVATDSKGRVTTVTSFVMYDGLSLNVATWTID